jgi:hypothetical protein
MFSVVAEAEERIKYWASSMIDCNHRMSAHKTDWLNLPTYSMLTVDCKPETKIWRNLTRNFKILSVYVESIRKFYT